ncbi:hypothetical protein BJX62DRAFT_249770 [Aspergillus germanicus]
MIARLFFLPLLAVTFLLISVCAALDMATPKPLRSPSRLWPVPQARDAADGLSKRRMHISNAHSDSTSQTAPSSSTGFNTNNNNNKDDQTPTVTIRLGNRCPKQKNTTRILTNPNGYGYYYSTGLEGTSLNDRFTHSNKSSTSGGTTLDGSGSAPLFNNRTGAFVALKDIAAASKVDNNDQHFLSYLGGAAVPYKAGTKSPNGVSPRRFDNLAFATVKEAAVKDGACAVPNTSYAYKYESTYNLSNTSIPVYCACDLYSLCGCDDFHKNDSFVPTLLSYLGLGDEARNVSKLCTVSIDGATAILINGGLVNGSTKADPKALPVITRVPTSKTTRCPAGSGSDSSDFAYQTLIIRNRLKFSYFHFCLPLLIATLKHTEQTYLVVKPAE